MATRLARKGIQVDLCPVLRLRYHTWDAVGRADVSFRLPEHLAEAFGTPEAPAAEFAARWRQVVRRQEKLLKTLSRVRRPQELMQLLGHEDHPRWLDRLDSYVTAHEALLDIQRRVDTLKHRADDLRSQERKLKATASRQERLRGKISRLVKPLRARLEELEAGHAPRADVHRVREELICYQDGELPDLDKRLSEVRARLSQVQSERRRVVREYRGLETGTAAREARRSLASVETEAEAARIRLAAQAFCTARGLPYTDHRPTAWWLPIVDPRGNWYRAILESTELEVEEMA